ncbi:hypothetical protein RWD45_16295 [Virgibacillus soli]|uniref:Uncharacterized protein n=2 Tax=Paracerasibacillus soli TaxID=480284 RepID=A0ABU5CTZ8_9BACI|nr:hypothetical protein [Virgibacillus soli]MDY0409849.1 hypothetical protein [Virgibacillus soli]
MIVVGEQTSSELVNRLYDAMDGKSDEYKVGISELPVPGFTIRVFANSTQVIERIFTECHDIVKREWYQSGSCFLRKY